MNLINLLIPDFVFKDERGSLTQLIRDGYKQINVISSICGAIRGSHYHQYNTEAFYVISGSVKLLVYDYEKKQQQTFYFKSGDMFEIPPLIVHEFNFIEDTILISMYSHGVELKNGKKDILSAEKENMP